MWGTKKSEPAILPSRESSPPSGSHDLRPLSEPRMSVVRGADGLARLGRTLSLKGELSGSEDLYLDAELDGTVDLQDGSLTVGPQGRVQADIRAREIIIEGNVRGNLRAADRLMIRKTGNVAGDLVAARIVIEDGAFFKGSIDIQKPEEPAKMRRGDVAAGDSFRITPAPLEAKDKLQ